MTFSAPDDTGGRRPPAGVRPPRLRVQLGESLALAESAALPLWLPVLRRAPRGDGHHVVVLPGFLAGDGSTLPLRRYLRSLGYVVHGWGLGRNVGPTPRIIDGLRARLEELAVGAAAPVSLLGWSLGGMYVREIAREAPQAIRYIATLGSPIRARPGDKSPASVLFDRLSSRYVAAEPIPAEELRDPPAMPSSSFYTRTDGLMRWQLCLDGASEDGRHENVEVRGTHSGLGMNPAVLYALADRLACVSEGGRWAPFQAPRLLQPLYPPARTWAPRVS